MNKITITEDFRANNVQYLDITALLTFRKFNYWAIILYSLAKFNA